MVAASRVEEGCKVVREKREEYVSFSLANE